MPKHRNPRQRLPKRATPDNHRLKLPAPPPEPDDGLESLLYVLLDQLRRTDAFATTAENELMESWVLADPSDEDEDGDSGGQRRRMRAEYLIEAAKLENREAQHTADQLVAEWSMYKRRA